MTSNRTTLVMGAVIAIAVPGTARAQNASIGVRATVQARPLSVMDAVRTSVPGELVVRVEGCGSGALAVDARTAARTIRTSRVVLDAGAGCGARHVLLHLPTQTRGVLAYVVTLEQSDALMSPSFAQFVLPAAGAGPRTTLAY